MGCDIALFLNQIQVTLQQLVKANFKLALWGTACQSITLFQNVSIFMKNTISVFIYFYEGMIGILWFEIFLGENPGAVQSQGRDLLPRSLPPPPPPISSSSRGPHLHLPCRLKEVNVFYLSWDKYLFERLNSVTKIQNSKQFLENIEYHFNINRTQANSAANAGAENETFLRVTYLR